MFKKFAAELFKGQQKENGGGQTRTTSQQLGDELIKEKEKTEQLAHQEPVPIPDGRWDTSEQVFVGAVLLARTLSVRTGDNY